MEFFNTKSNHEGDLPKGRFDGAYLKSWLEPLVKKPVSRFEFFTLKGDASDRSYFRVNYTLQNSQESSIIVMQLKEPDCEKEPDFNRMQKFLIHQGIPVPEILYYDAKRGLIFWKMAEMFTWKILPAVPQVKSFSGTKRPLSLL